MFNCVHDFAIVGRDFALQAKRMHSGKQRQTLKLKLVALNLASINRAPTKRLEKLVGPKILVITSLEVLDLLS